jgi:hypothetical protein
MVTCDFDEPAVSSEGGGFSKIAEPPIKLQMTAVLSWTGMTTSNLV